MSALSLPANPVLSQNKPASQANNSNAVEASDTPFASVLKQKVQDGQDKPAEQSAAPAEQAQPQVAQNTEPQPPSAMAVANGDYAQTALQQLLPWLQAMQGQAEQSGDTSTAADESLIVQLNPAQQPGLQLAATLVPQEENDKTSAELPADLLKDGKTASATANVAASTEALSSIGKRTGAHESFDASLQGANERLDMQAQAGTTGNTSRSSEPVRLQAPLGTPQWQTELGDRLQFMSRNNESQAELVLTPPQLGRIEVSLNINGDQASALFVSANPEVRTALEGAMDRLREALANNGITLGQAQVGSESREQTAGNGQGGQGRNGAAAGEVQEAAAGAWTRHSNNMLDVFA